MRSYPGALLADIVRSLGKAKAYCVIGSSQGACAVFNALLEVPRLADFVAVCHPVGHDVSRYSRIRQPALLCFDEDDDGHPIAVGRRMRACLPVSFWHEFKSSVTPDWLDDHMPTELLRMFAVASAPATRGGPPPPSAAAATGNDDRLPDLTKVAGGVGAWCRAYGTEYEDWATPLPTGAGTSVTFVGGGGEPAADATAATGSWRAELDPATNRVVYINDVLGIVSDRRPVGQTVQMKRLDAAAAAGGGGTGIGPGGGGAGGGGHVLFDADDDAEARAEAAAAAEAAARAGELLQDDCDRCGGALLDAPAPVRLPACRHVLCPACVVRTLVYHRTCPVCTAPTDGAAGVQLSGDGATRWDDDELAARLADRHAGSDRFDAQRHAHAAALREAQESAVVVLEIGNTSSSATGRSTQKTFVRVAGKGVQFGSAAARRGYAKVPAPLIKRVDFNINPGYAKPTARVSSPERGVGFALERALAFTYPCHATVHFADALALPPVTLEYYTQMEEPVATMRVAVRLPRSRADAGGTSRPGAGKARPVVFDPRNGEGWVLLGDGDEPAARYNAEPEAVAAATGKKADTSSARFRRGGGGRGGGGTGGGR